MPYCPNCGALVKAGERYCFGCGTKIAGAVESLPVNPPVAEPTDEQASEDNEDIPQFKEEDYGPQGYENDEMTGDPSEQEPPYPQRYPPKNRTPPYNPQEQYGEYGDTEMNRQQIPPDRVMPQGQPYQNAPVAQPQVQPAAPAKQKTGILSIIAKILEIVFYLGLIAAVCVGLYLLYNFANSIALNPLA